MNAHTWAFIVFGAFCFGVAFGILIDVQLQRRLNKELATLRNQLEKEEQDNGK